MSTSNEATASEIWNALWSLECAYWADVDLEDGLGAADFYTQDAVFDTGIAGATFEGREAIGKFYETRRASPRTTLHVVHNFNLTESSGEHARSRAYVALYFALGTAPQAAGPPSLISVCDTAYRREERRWFITERRSRPVFADPTYQPPASDKSCDDSYDTTS